MHILLLACSVVAAIAAFVCAVVARSWSRDAAHHAERLMRMRGRVLALEGQYEGLLAQHRKLSGRFFAELSRWRGDDPAEDDPIYGSPESPQFAAAIPEPCEKWRAAQRDGPQSPAAQCMCAYCDAMRAERRRIKAQLVPKTNSDRIEAIKRGLEQRE